jgi:hypothetical protein
LDGNAGPSPPSSATSADGSPRRRRISAVPRRTRQAISIASLKLCAPIGTTNRSWMSRAPPACAPPEMMLIIGRGKTGVLPALAVAWYSG